MRIWVNKVLILTSRKTEIARSARGPKSQGPRAEDVLAVWHDQCNWAQCKYFNYRMICLIECLDQVGMLFLSDLSRQKCIKNTGQQGFDVPDSPTGHGEERKDFRRHRTQMETGRQMCRTRDRTADRVRGIKQREFALLSECADNQKTRLAVGTNKDIALLRVRGEVRREFRAVQVRGEIKPGPHTVCVRKPCNFALFRVRGPSRMINSHGSTTADTNLFLAEFTKRSRCDNHRSGTQHQ